MDQMEPNPAPETTARISAQSRRQAMDWSLVLASQDIHPIIEPPSETQPWGLLVPPGEYERAIAAIRQYRVENRGWAWRRELPGGVLEVHAGALFWCLFLAFWHWAATFGSPALEARGRMDSTLVRAGQWWRLVTAVMLHADLAHLMANVTFGLLILGFAMARFGPGIALLATYLAGVIGNLAGLLLYFRPYTGLGASGMMMGALGLLSVHSVSLWRHNRKAARYVSSGVFAGLLLFIFFGVSPNSDILAHFGGFVAGVAFGSALSFADVRSLEKPFANWLAFATMVVLVVVSWACALTAAPR